MAGESVRGGVRGTVFRSSGAGLLTASVLAGAVLVLALSGCAADAPGQTPEPELDYRVEFVDPGRLGFEPVSPIRQSFEPEGLPIRERVPEAGTVVGGAGTHGFEQALRWLEADAETEVGVFSPPNGSPLAGTGDTPEWAKEPHDAWIDLTRKPTEATLDRLRTESKERILVIWGGIPATSEELETVSQAIFDAFTAGLPLAAAEPDWTENEFVVDYRLAEATDVDLEQHARDAAEAGARASEDGALPMPVRFDYQPSMEETDDFPR
ncbi:hypothetical protein J4H92_09320 [Leucobacter weissii]|uniref:Uncharacterized protein n=1 Tax=Leucobacter weissii TaxID=1983706 RepID=A0A939MJK5_9MICO|nr:hypothetical protein [Leucobacter weissii]MBO1902144.1 hypothetical protein [Leucobacter weissii]